MPRPPRPPPTGARFWGGPMCPSRWARAHPAMRDAPTPTGPKTPAGKAASARSAMKHGLLSRGERGRPRPPVAACGPPGSGAMSPRRRRCG